MAKQVRGPLPEGLRINETMLRVLKVIRDRAKGSSRGVCISRQELSELCGKGSGTMRRSCQLLDDYGLIEINSRYQKNGGQLENEYIVTSLGEQVLEMQGL